MAAPPITTKPAGSSPPPAITGSLALGILHEVLLALAHNAPREAVLGMLAEKARLLTGCGSATIALLDVVVGGGGGDDRDALTFAAVAGADSRELQGTRVLASDSIAGTTARTGEPLLSFQPGNSAAIVPIFVDGAPVGALAALNKDGDRPFGGDDLLSLSTLAAAASVALANQSLREGWARQGRELSTLYEAVRTVSGQLSAQEVLSVVAEQVAAHIPSSAVAVFLVNDERTHFYIAADWGLEDDKREVTLATDIGLGAAALIGTRPLFLTFDESVSDAESNGFRPGSAFEPPFPGMPLRSALAAPIRSGDVTHGLILAVSGGIDAYALADANLLSALAAQAAVAIENAWLYEDATRRAEEAAALYELSQAVTSTLHLDAILDVVADSVLNLVAVDKFALFLRDSSTERLKMVVERGLPGGAAERNQPQVGQGIPGWVLEFETPTAVQDVAADHRNTSAPLHPEGVVSMTCMPLQVGARAIGVLCAMSSRRRLFTVAEMELLYTIANQAAIAIENARMYADVRQKAVELRRYFHRVARALGAPGSPDAVPKMIATLTQEIMAADRCVLYSIRDGSLIPEASFGFRPGAGPEGALPLTEDLPAGWVARRAKTLTLEDVTEDPRFSEGVARVTRGRIASYLGVPLRLGKQVVGVLEVYTRAPRRFRADEIRLLLTFASQAVVAFQNARLAAQSGRAARDAAFFRGLLELSAQSETVTPEAVAGLLSRQWNASVAVFRKSADGVWESADVTSAPLRTALEDTAPTPGFARANTAEIALVAGPKSDPLPSNAVDLLTAALRILTREHPFSAGTS